MTILSYGVTTNFIKIGINAKATGATLVGTVKPGMAFAPLTINWECSAITGASTGPTFSVGTNASTYNNIMAATSFGTPTLNKKGGTILSGNKITVPAGTQIFVNVTLATASTTMSMNIFVEGIYF